MTSSLFYILFSLAAFSLLLRFLFALVVFQPVGKLGKLYKAKQLEGDHPPVSVVIAAKNEAENLRQFLPEVLTQDYPDFEVVVVDDCSGDDTREVLSKLQINYPNLIVSWVPENAINRGGKKLALSIGIKAAKNEWLLFTDADCYPVSENWISCMAEYMHDKNDFVLGYGAYRDEKSMLNRLIRFDTLKIALRYAGFARLGQAYMGVGRNLAYRKSIWVENRGFAAFSNSLSGDDDLFVNAYAKSKRTGLCFSADGKTESIPANSFFDWKSQKSRHMSTSRYYSFFLRFLIILEPVNQVLSPIFIAFFAVLFWGNIYVYALLGALLLIKLTESLVFRHKTLMVNEVKLVGRSIIFDVLLPLIYVIFVFSRTKKSKNNAWK